MIETHTQDTTHCCCWTLGSPCARCQAARREEAAALIVGAAALAGERGQTRRLISSDATMTMQDSWPRRDAHRRRASRSFNAAACWHLRTQQGRRAVMSFESWSACWSDIMSDAPRWRRQNSRSNARGVRGKPQ